MDPNLAYSSGGLSPMGYPTLADGGLQQTAGPPIQSGTTLYGGGGGGGGSVLGATTSVAPPDPYAQWGGLSNYNNLRSGFATQKQNIYGTANDAAGNAGVGYKGSILDFVDSLGSGQRAIDNKGVNNEMAKRTGTQGVMGMVGRGIRSAGVQLANRNAGDSSAAGALANAYGQIGRGQLTNIGNQYEMGNRDINMAQQDLDAQEASGVRRLADSKTQIVNNIVADARNKFAELDAQIANASLPDRIAIEQEKEAVRQQVLGQLQQYDQLLSERTAAINPTSIEERRAEATRLAGLGQAPENAFTYTDEVPGQFQGTGPFASELPLFTLPRRRTA